MYLDVVFQRVLWLCVFVGQSTKVLAARHTVYWNSTNPRFHGGDYTVHVDINDYLDIVCPHYPGGARPGGQVETFQLYMVDSEGYGRCQLAGKSFKRWECNRPFAPFTPVRFLEKIQVFTPFSLGFEFRPGTNYYYISITPESEEETCLRLKVSVCCPTTVKPTTKVSEPRLRERTQQDSAKSRPGNGASSLTLGVEASLLGLVCTCCLWQYLWCV